MINMYPYTQRIVSHLETIRKKGGLWENEYGGILQKSSKLVRKDAYHSQQDYKVEYYTQGNISYFKILPSYYRIPNSRVYWETYDGYIQNETIFWSHLDGQ